MSRLDRILFGTALGSFAPLQFAYWESKNETMAVFLYLLFLVAGGWQGWKAGGSK